MDRIGVPDIHLMCRDKAYSVARSHRKRWGAHALCAFAAESEILLIL